MNRYRNIDFQGHRGCRGLYPENSIPGFLEALRLGVTTLEMDTVISKDHQVVVSHEPFFSHEISLTPHGKSITEEQEKAYNLYLMDYSEIVKYDCGSKPHPRFPEQNNIKVYKPLLREVITVAEAYTLTHKLPPVYYNIEIKSTVEGDFKYHPNIELFSDLLIEVLQQSGVVARTTIQCFDIRVLQYLKSNYNGLTLSFLVENELGIEENIKMLGFTPSIYSPIYVEVDQEVISFSKRNGMKVLPWTVNEIGLMKDLISLGVDGIISDYPNLFKHL